MSSSSKPDEIQLTVDSFPSVSVVEGEPLTFTLNRPVSSLVVQIVRVNELEDSFALSAPCDSESENVSAVKCEAVGTLKVGLYALVALNAPSLDGFAPGVQIQLQPAWLFEVRSASEPAREISQLLADYRKVVEERSDRLQKGLGSGNVHCGVLIFIKDLLITTPMHLGAYQITPLAPIGWGAEKTAVEQVWAQMSPDPLVWPDELQAQLRQAEPAALIEFRSVHAASEEECLNIAMRHGQLLTAVLAGHRGSLGSPVCALLINETTHTLRMTTFAPSYRGNLLGGPMSGEDPSALRAELPIVAADATLEFYVNLLGEALREERTEFRYVRFWSLLETIARGRSYIGRPLKDWDGVPRLNNKQQPRYIRDDALELVCELLREVLQPRGIGEQTFSGGGIYGDLGDELELCYRRRNCTAHGDQRCVCRQPNLAKSESGIRLKCFQARKADPLNDQHHLSTLRELANSVVFGLVWQRVDIGSA